MDVTGIEATIIACVEMERHTNITIAEMSCGGVNGWGQAAWLLHRAGIPAHHSWSLDVTQQFCQ